MRHSPTKKAASSDIGGLSAVFCNLGHIQLDGGCLFSVVLETVSGKDNPLQSTMHFQEATRASWLRAAFVALTCAFLMLGGACAAAVEQAAPAQKSLYERLGGYDALAAVTKDLASRLVADPKLGRFWANRGKDGVDREVQLITDFLAAKSGGPLYYRGREMKLSHVGMKIDERDWQALMIHLNATLDKFNVPAKERQDVVTFIESTKKDIVEIR
jgi:hemoglobin